MKISPVFLNLIFIALISCGGDTSSQDSNNSEVNERKSAITAKAIERFSYKDYVLSAKAENKLAEWEKYQELAIQISYLKKADLSFFNGDKEVLKKFITAFKSEIPEDLKTNPIISRVAVIETTLLRLNENLTLDNIDDNLKLESVKEILVAFSNLNFQVNKKIERDIYDQIKSDY